MAKKTVNSDIYNLSQLVDDLKSVFIPDETEETLAIGTFGYIGALESHRLQTQVQMTGELANEVFPSRARLERNVITHAIVANIDDINAIPAKMTAFLAIKEEDISDLFSTENIFIIDRDCPLYIEDFEFHLEYDVELKRILTKKNTYTYTARYIVPSNRDVPTSTITTSQYLNPPVVVMVGKDPYIYLTVLLAQVEHQKEERKLVTSSIVDNKTMNFEFENQLAYFEIHSAESDEDYYLLPVLEGSAVPSDTKMQYYCWYQYIDTNLIRVRFDRSSYMPGLNSTVECLIKTCQGASGNFSYSDSVYVTLESDTSRYNYKGITCLLTPISDSTGGKDKKSKKELQTLIPKEYLSRGSLTTITDLNNYFSMLDSEYGRVIIQKKIDNQMERVYYTYFVAKDSNLNVIPSNTIDVKVGLDDLVVSNITESEATRYLLRSGTCFKLGDDGIGYVNHDPILDKGLSITPNMLSRGKLVTDTLKVTVTDDSYDAVSCSAIIGSCNTPTRVFPGSSIIRYEETGNETEVEDYMQMGVGNDYLYTGTYTTRNANSTITINQSSLSCLDWKEAWYYIGNPEDKIYFDALPITINSAAKNAKIRFGIKNTLNGNLNRITTFSYNGSEVSNNGSNEFLITDLLTELSIPGELQSATLSSVGSKEYKHISISSDNKIIIEDGFEDYEANCNVVTSQGNYTILVTRDINTIINNITIIENTNEYQIGFTTFVPTISQDTTPTELTIGDNINYTVRYRSCSATYQPTMIIKLSRGLTYNILSNTISYEDGESYSYEPSEVSLEDEVGFLYTNPYAANINGYKLYSSFYMMAVEENPYIKFSYVNEASNIQFIATNIYWTRPFAGDNEYTLRINVTQSVQEDLGLIVDDTCLVKAFAVFKRDGSNYRYRSLDLIECDSSLYSFTFSQTFNSADLFDTDNNIKIGNVQVTGQKEFDATLTYGDGSYSLNNGEKVLLSVLLSTFGITGTIKTVSSSNTNCLGISKILDTSGSVTDYEIIAINYSDETEKLYITTEEAETPYEISATFDIKTTGTEGYFAPNTSVDIYVLCALEDSNNTYSRYTFDSICPGYTEWTLTNIYEVVNGVTTYHNYSEIMGSRVEPYGTNVVEDNEVVGLATQGYIIKGIPMLGYDYCQDDTLVQSAINSLNYRKAYMDNALDLLENSSGLDFKLFNTYGPSEIYYIARDSNSDNVLDDSKEFINRVNITLNFRIKLTAQNDSYTKDNIIAEIKEYIEDLDEIGEIHIPNLVTQITTNYKEQISYFEYLGFNKYGPEVQHIYRLDDSEIPIHTAPEFINVNNVDSNGSLVPDINIYISEI